MMGLRGRLAAFAAVAEIEAPRSGEVAPLMPTGPRPLTRWQLVRRRLFGVPSRRTAPSSGRRRAAVMGLATGLFVGWAAGLLAQAWQERDVAAGLLLTLIVTVTSLVRWWQSRSTMLAAFHLASVLAILWLMTPASRIIYQSDRDTGYRSQIYVTTATGGSTDRLTSSPTLESGARLAPNGRQIAVAHYQDANTDLYITEPDGSRPRNLTRHPAEEIGAAWSPDGLDIVFQSNRTGNWDLYVLSVDGANLRKLTSGPANDEAPAWSPDGRSIAFQSDREGFFQIYIIDLGGHLVQLTSGRHDNRAPAWSPDGSRLAFQSQRDGHWQLYVVDFGSRQPQRLLASLSNDMMPAWSPDGESVVFVSDRDGNFELYAVRVDGSYLRRLTTTPTDESHPQWVTAGPVNWSWVRRNVFGWLSGFLPVFRQPVLTWIEVGQPVNDSDSPAGESGLPLAPGEDRLPPIVSRPTPIVPPGSQPSPTPGLRPVPTCAPGSFWC